MAPGVSSMAFLLLCTLMLIVDVPGTHGIGVNYGRQADNLPEPADVVALCRRHLMEEVRIYDADVGVVAAFRGSGIPMTISVTNEEVYFIAGNATLAQNWVADRVLVHLQPPNPVQIRSIIIGNEMLSMDGYDGSTLVPAMENIYNALVSHGLGYIHVSTTHSVGVLSSEDGTWPPSAARFVAPRVMRPLLDFLNRTGSPLMIDVYPFLVYKQYDTVSLESCLFQPNAENTDPYSDLIYTNLLDQMVDSFYYAMSALGYDDIDIVIAETGWATNGDPDENGANVANAQTYISNLVRHVALYPGPRAPPRPIGTPLRPGRWLRTFIFALFNEDSKPGPTSERNFGLFTPTDAPVYNVLLADYQVASK